MSRIKIECSEPSDYVYLIYDPAGYVKIGITEANGLDRRLRQIQNGNPRRLTMIDAFAQDTRGRAQWQEAKLHKFFDYARVEGEWFKAAPVLCWYDWICTQRSFFIGNEEYEHTDDFFKLAGLPMPTNEPMETFAPAWERGERESILRRRGLVDNDEWKAWAEAYNSIEESSAYISQGEEND